MGTIQIDGSTPKLTIGNATAEDATILFDGNAQDFHSGLDDSSDDLVIGVGSALGTTTALAIDENAGSTFSGTVTVGVDDTGKDVKFFGASAGAYMEWDESADQLRIMGASADATTSTGKLLLATSLTDINANDEIGKIEFQAPHEAGGTDAITVAASIKAVAQATYTSSVNETDLIFSTGHSEAAAEKIRITSQNEIGIAGANYGTDGQVLTSGGAGAAVAWEDAAGFDVTSITGATALAEEPDPADEMVISDGGTLKRLDMKHMMCRPTFYAGRQTAATLGDTYAVMSLTSERFDPDSTFDHSSTFRFTPGVPGMYFLCGGITWNTSSDFDKGEIAIYENASDIVAYGSYANRDKNIMVCSTIINSVDDDDYFDLRAKHEDSSTAALGGMDKQFFFGFRLLGAGN